METSSGMGAALQTVMPPSAQESKSTQEVTKQEAKEPASIPDNDGDKDDKMASSAAKKTPAVNAMGETIGKLINVSA